MANALARHAAVVDMVTGGSTVAATAVVVPVPDPLAPVRLNDVGSINTNELLLVVNRKPKRERKSKLINTARALQIT